MTNRVAFQRVRGKARDAANGRSLGKSRNAASRSLERNPKGRTPTWRRAALLGTHLEQPNHVPRALPCTTWASVAVVIKRQQTLMLARLTAPISFSLARYPHDSSYCHRWRRRRRSGVGYPSG